MSEAFDFVYFQIPKVATRSLLRTLREIDPDAVEYNKIGWRPRQFKDMRSFAFVRDPLDRLHSCWANKVRDSNQFAQFYPELADADFPAFIDVVSGWDLRTCDAHVRLQSRLVPRQVDFVGRFDRLDEDFAELSSWLELPITALSQLNASRPLADEHRYSPELSEQVKAMYEPDFNRFGFLEATPRRE